MPSSLPCLTLSFFERDTSPLALDKTEATWPDFISRLMTTPRPAETPKRELPLWAPVSFKGDYRNRPNVELVYALTLDVDEEPVPNRAVLEEELAGLTCAIHSSSRATTTAPRWRAVILLSRPVTSVEYDALWATFTADLPFEVGDESKDPSRGWYFPRQGTDGTYEMFTIEGEPLDVDSWLENVALAPSTAPLKKTNDLGNTRLGTNAGTTTHDPVRTAQLSAAATLLGKAWPSQGRHQAQLALAGALYHQGWDAEQALDFLCEVTRTAGDEDRAKRSATIRHTWQKGEAGGKILGWTSLASSLGREGARIVDQARSLVTRDDFAAAREELGQALGQATLTLTQGLHEEGLEQSDDIPPRAPPQQGGGLGFIYGAWENEPPPTEFLVEGLIPSESVIMFFGRANSMKTWLAFSIALALSSGTPWLGKYKTKRCRVGIVDYETGTNGIARRLYMLRAGRDQNLGVVSFTKLKPNTPEFWVELARERFDIVFIDSLRKANPGADENDSDESIIPLSLAAEFSEHTGCAVVFIHHAKKSSSDGWPEFRGSAGIEDQVDCSFAVRKIDDEGKVSIAEVHCVKPGDMKLPEDFSVEVEFNDNARTAKVRAHDAPKGAPGGEGARESSFEELQAKIRLLLKSKTISSQAELRQALGGGRHQSVVDALKTLVERGEVSNVPNGQGGSVYILDDDSKRRARVFLQVERVDNWESAAKLATAAGVQTAFVDELVRTGVITANASGRDAKGYFIVER